MRYFRPSDYYYMAGSTLAFPGALWLMESASPARGKGKLSAAMKLSAALGLCGGFLYAYQRSTCTCHGLCMSALVLTHVFYLIQFSPFLGLDRECA